MNCWHQVSLRCTRSRVPVEFSQRLIASDNLRQASPQQGPGVMPHPVLLSAILEESGPIVAQMMTLVEGPQWEQTGVAGDLATGEIGANPVMTIEGEAQLRSAILRVKGISSGEIALGKKGVPAVNKSAGTSGAQLKMTIVRVQFSLAA